MAYVYKTCEDMTYPFTTNVLLDTEYRIYDSSGATPDTTYTPVHSCVVLRGDHLEHLQDVLAQYISISDRNNWNGQTITNATNAEKTFYIYASVDHFSTWEAPVEYKLYYDWDYDETEYDANRVDLNYKRSNPIEYILDKRQRFLFTIYNSGNCVGDCFVQADANNVWQFTPPTYGYVTYQLDLSQSGYVQSSSTLYFRMYNPKDYPEWKLQKTCYRYCLYYVNRLGGWDSVLMDGKSVQKEDAKASQIKKWAQFGSTNFGRKDYRKELAQSWELTKTNLTDEQASKMNRIAFSNHIYLHDLETNKILPVTYVDNSFEWKKVKNNNRKLNQVTMNFKASQDKYILN